MTADAQPLDLDAALLRAERAYAFLRADADGREFLPLSVREHFNYDVPALIGEIRWLRKDAR